MKTIIPQIGDWVSCERKESHGKVLRIFPKEGIFIGEFFSEDGSPEENELFVWEIVGIVTDKNLIAELEAELAGKMEGLF